MSVTLHPHEDRAVATVLGVVLLLATTLVLAAAVGGFALDAGEQSLQTTPHPAIGVDDAQQDFDPDAASAFATITHEGGDRVALSDVEIVVRRSGTAAPVDTWRGDWDHGVFTPLPANATLAPGDTVTLRTTADAPAVSIPDVTEYQVLVVHEETGTVVAEDTVDVV